MKIVHLSCIAPPKIGGMGRVAFLEMRGLKEKGFDAHLLTPLQSPPACLHHSDVSELAGRLRKGRTLNESPPCEGGDEGVVRVPTYWSFGNAAALRYDLLQDCVRDADIVHLHYPFYGTAGMVARLRYRGVIKRLMMTLHMDATADGLKGLYFNLHRKIAQPKILRAADALLVSSLDYARHSSFAPFADRCIELPFGVDEKRFSPLAARRQNNPQLRATSYELLFVCGMDKAHAFKGVDVLLRAMMQMSKHVTLTLVGDGDLRPGYEKMAKDLGIADRITFRGRVSDEELPDVYRGADIFVFPSTSGAEAFGLAALEAQACGVPVIASDLPGVRTVVANGETGFLVPPNDVNALAERLAYLLDHPDVRHAMGKRARERVLERFTWSKHFDGLLDVYQKLMQKIA